MQKKIVLSICVSLIIAVASLSQTSGVTISGLVKNKANKEVLPYVNIFLQNGKDTAFIVGTVSNEDGRFTLSNIKSGSYVLQFSFTGFQIKKQPILVGKLSTYLDLGVIELQQNATVLNEVVVNAKQNEVSGKMEKKAYSISANISQAGGSVLQALRNLPSVTTTQDGKIELRGSDKVTILIDGKQTALTGFGSQTGLDNIPASAIERIEIINNPSAKNDANGSAGIINIIFKKNQQEGFNGKIGFTNGLGALWQKQENLPSIRPQYQSNYKFNPSLALNYRKRNINTFFQGDFISQKGLNKNEFFERSYADNLVIRQQFLENRKQTISTIKTGLDWYINNNNMLSFSALYNREGHIDRGDLPYFNQDLSTRKRLWQYYEDEVNTAINTSMVYEHKFKQAGHKLNVNFNYTFHREDEKFNFDNYLVSSQSSDVTKLIADENVSDLNIDYVKPLKQGRLEIGTKLRWRYIPTNMVFVPGQNSVLDLGAQGWANYNEYIGSLYTNYIYESKHFEVEVGLRMESVLVDYEVTPQHNTYKSGGYNYTQPFPNFRIAYLLNDHNKISLFYNRRVDRPDEQDLRIFPKYDDPEILKTGNPNLRPQFTQTIELGYKSNWQNGFVYSAVYVRFINDILTRIVTAPTNSTFLNSISQNANSGRNEGIELVLNQQVNKWLSFNLNLNVYQNTLAAFTIDNVYPFNVSFTSNQQQIYSGNFKVNGIFKLPNNWNIQFASIYLAPDIIPQGKIFSRYSLDVGAKKGIQQSKGELFFNATDILNTLRIKKEINGTAFELLSTDFYETQVFRLGYSYKF